MTTTDLVFKYYSFIIYSNTFQILKFLVPSHKRGGEKKKKRKNQFTYINQIIASTNIYYRNRVFSTGGIKVFKKFIEKFKKNVKIVYFDRISILLNKIYTVSSDMSIQFLEIKFSLRSFIEARIDDSVAMLHPVDGIEFFAYFPYLTKIENLCNYPIPDISISIANYKRYQIWHFIWLYLFLFP